MSYLDDSIRELDRLHRAGEHWDAGAELGDLFEQLAREARCGDLKIEPTSRFAHTPDSAWMELNLTAREGRFVRLEVGKGRS